MHFSDPHRNDILWLPLIVVNNQWQSVWWGAHLSLTLKQWAVGGFRHVLITLKGKINPFCSNALTTVPGSEPGPFIIQLGTQTSMFGPSEIYFLGSWKFMWWGFEGPWENLFIMIFSTVWVYTVPIAVLAHNTLRIPAMFSKQNIRYTTVKLLISLHSLREKMCNDRHFISFKNCACKTC